MIWQPMGLRQALVSLRIPFNLTSDEYVEFVQSDGL